MPKSTLKKISKTMPYDIAEQLRTPEEMAAYLDAWLDETPDDATGIGRALGDIARAKGMTQVAKDAGLSRESLYRALSADGNPSFATVLKVARALGVKLHAEAAQASALGSHMESLDPAIETMRRTGADMQTKYKETSLGGLAITVSARQVEC